jgi:nitroreductase
MDSAVLLPYIDGRYSPFTFSDKMIEEDTIRILFKAAGRAPSSFNDQPWYFLYATKQYPEMFKQYYECLAAGNQKWAYTAPVLALSLARTYYTRNNKANPMSGFETGMAVGNLLVQAMSMGIYVHQMGGFDKEKARANLNIPVDFDLLTMMAIGFPGDPAALPAELYERATRRTGRKAVNEFVFSGKFPESL